MSRPRGCKARSPWSRIQNDGERHGICRSEEPAAVVHLGAGLAVSEAELQQFCRERIAAFKVPVEVKFWHETLPRNANGKILKKDLRALFEG